MLSTFFKADFNGSELVTEKVLHLLNGGSFAWKDFTKAFLDTKGNTILPPTSLAKKSALVLKPFAKSCCPGILAAIWVIGFKTKW